MWLQMLTGLKRVSSLLLIIIMSVTTGDCLRWKQSASILLISNKLIARVTLHLLDFCYSFKCCESYGDGKHFREGFILQSNGFSPYTISSWTTVLQFLQSFPPQIRAGRLQQQAQVQSCPVTLCLEHTETLRVWFSLISFEGWSPLPHRTQKSCATRPSRSPVK